MGMPVKNYLDETHLFIPVRFFPLVEIEKPTLNVGFISLAGSWTGKGES